MDRQGKDHVKFSGITNIANDSSVYKPVSSNTAKMTAPPYSYPEALSSTTGRHFGPKSPEVFQLKQRSCIDLSRVKLSEVMKSSSFDNAATQSLLGAVYGILDESIGRQNGEIPQRAAGILRNFVQEIERRICTQREHLAKQSSLFKTREEKYQSRIKVLEALATGTDEGTKMEKSKLEEKRKREDYADVQRVIKQKDDDSERLVQQKEQDYMDIQRVANQKDDNLQRFLDDKVQQLQQLVQEKEQDLLNVQKVMKDKEEEFERMIKQKEENAQRLLDEKVKDLQKLVQEKEQNLVDVQKVMKDVEEEFHRVMKQNQEDVERLSKEKEGYLYESVQQKEQRVVQATEDDLVMKDKEEELQRVTKQDEEVAQMLLHKKVQDLQKLVQEKEQNLLDVQRMMKDKEKEFQKIMKQEEENMERLLKEKERDVQELVLQKEQRLVEETEQDLIDVQRMMKDKEEEFQRVMKQKEEDMQKMVLEREHGMEKLVKEKEQDLEKLKHEKELDVKRLIEEEKRKMMRLVQEKEQDMQRLLKEKDELNDSIENLRKELEATKQACEQHTLKTKQEAEGVQQELERRLKETVGQLTESKNRVKELEGLSESNSQRWKKKQHIYQLFTEYQLGALRELRGTSQSIQQEIVISKKSYSEEFKILGSRFQVLDNAAKSYYSLLAENQKIHNELQDLKGNIRVYCRIRPFLPGQKSKQTIIEYIGENGELVVMNPSKPGKEGRRSFKFNKVYGPSATQAEVFADTKPLIQSVLDGYNVCIFAYGQTGSGKTYTMMGPDGGTEEEWGVNYRALNNLFHTSHDRESSFTYEISVQMVEIYNEQVRDLLSNDGAQKRLGISYATQSGQSNGLAVPDASIHPVSSTSDVLELTNIGQKNRAKSATAMNERSSRSHSVLSIHIRGTDLKSASTLRGSLHLVDLAGSERVDRSEVTGDRLKEAQHINKSLAALGDVVFALAQKSSHIPYRNSKLTQVLQSSLGGQAKTLMFVQINPDATSYSESLSTLKFAERVSGVELGAAKSSKEGRDVRELMEQVSSLKDTIAKKDEEIEALQLAADSKNSV